MNKRYFTWHHGIRKLANFSLLALVAIVLYACGASHNTVSNGKLKPVKVESPTKTVERTAGLRALDSNFSGKNTSEIDKLIKDAQKYLGAPYKYGGDTSRGFDCSGFTFVVYEQNNYILPRRSSDQALTGDEIDIKVAKPGDLLFFATGSSSRVTHVGIVHDIGSNGEVKFIHASTSKGVIVSSLNEKYWNSAFLHAQRVL